MIADKLSTNAKAPVDAYQRRRGHWDFSNNLKASSTRLEIVTKAKSIHTNNSL